MNIFGLTSTRKSVVANSFPPLKNITKLKDLDNALEEGLKNLNRFDVFKKCEVFLDYDEFTDEVTINVLVDESKSKFKKVGANIQRDMRTLKTKLNFDVVFQNLVGFADKFSVGFNFSKNLNDMAFHSNYTFPIPRKFDVDVDLNLFEKVPLLKKYNSDEWLLQQKKDSLSLRLFRNRHQLMYDFSFRDVEEVISDNISSTFTLPSSIEIGKSIKSSISHTYTLNNRRNLSGHFFKLTNTFSGLGGNVNSFQTNVVSQKFIEIFKNLTLELRVDTGMSSFNYS
jgi:outer membrane protein assembly factor BamA